MLYNVPKNCAISGNISDSDSGSFVGWKFGSQHFSSNLGISWNICYSPFFPEQEEKMDSIRKIIDVTLQAVFVRMPEKYFCRNCE